MLYETGSWQVDSRRRELRLRGAAVPIGIRAFEIIEALAQSAGQIVSKDDLMDRVWPGAVVEENTLQVHISAIRKALGSDRGLLQTKFGRGYRLLGHWTTREQTARANPEDFALPPAPARPVRGNLPIAPSILVGRHAAVRLLLDLISAYRVVTLTGPGGIGKSRLALEVARLLSPAFAHDVWLVELASLSDGALIAATIAGAIRLDRTGSGVSAASLARAIGDRRLLLVIDNCEHLIDASATVAETIIRNCPAVSVLATSREIMRVEGERAYRVPPLDLPVDSAANAAADEILQTSAVQLFIARTAGTLAGEWPQEQLAAIAAICRRLDGIPLAIEFAAARAATLGSQDILSHLDNRFELLTSGRRTALPKHRTLRAVLDWSYDLLPDDERILLQRLSAFTGSFSLQAAIAVAGSNDAPPVAIADGIANLVAKSLLTIDASTDGGGRWRLLETTRSYALEKLAGSGAKPPIARRHAEFYRDLLAPVAVAADSHEAAANKARLAPEIDNVRGALDWAFSAQGDISLGAALTVSTVPVWMHLSMMVECRDRLQRAMTALEQAAGLAVDLQIRLKIALAVSLLYTMGSPDRIRSALAEVTNLASNTNDRDAQLRAAWASWTLHFNTGALGAARQAANRLLQLAAETGNPLDSLIGHRLLGNTLHSLGKQAEARRHLEQAIALAPMPSASRDLLWRHQDQQVLARAMLARVLWVQGSPDQAARHVEASMELAKEMQNRLSLRYALVWAACPVALLGRQLAPAERWMNALRSLSQEPGEIFYARMGNCLDRVLRIRQGKFADGAQALNNGLAWFDATGWTTCRVEFLAALAEGFDGAGQLANALSTIGRAREQCERSGEYRYFPELLRIQGELLLRSGESVAAEALFTELLRWAREQGALA